MSFWNTSDGAQVGNETTADMGGGNFDPIPDDTNVLAAIENAEIYNYNDENYINLRWSVLQPAEFENRKVFQKVRVWDTDTNKRDKAIRMLAAIDANCGGKLVASGEEPDDYNMQVLLNRPMVLNLQVWEMDTQDGRKTGNWVSMVAPRGNGQQQNQKQQVPAQSATSASKQQVPAQSDDIDDDIPF